MSKEAATQLQNSARGRATHLGQSTLIKAKVRRIKLTVIIILVSAGPKTR